MPVKRYQKSGELRRIIGPKGGREDSSSRPAPERSEWCGVKNTTKRYLTKSPTQTQKLGFRLAKRLAAGEAWSLEGDLGGGKTTLVKGVAKGLKIKKTINSPTFVLMKVYKTNHKKIKYLCHLDAYRLKNPREALGLGLEEYLKNPRALCLIEWGGKLKKILPKNYLTIRFQFINPKTRKITIS